MLNGDFTIQLYSTKRIYESTGSGEGSPVLTRVYTPLTTFINGHSNPEGTYDENLSVKTNSQYSLTFSISKIVEGKINPLFFMIVENRRLRLTTIDYVIDFIITGITPNITKNNVIYNVTCQDVFSYDWSKQNIKITYNSLEETNNVQQIDYHANMILKKSMLLGRYKIDETLENKQYADFPDTLTTNMVKWTTRVCSSIEVNDVTPFAAITELANKYNARIQVTYPEENDDLTTISFINQSLNNFKGLYIRPEINLNNFSISRKTDNFCSILRVEGGEDADGNIVGLMSNMPHEIEKYILDPLINLNISTKQLKENFINNENYKSTIETENYFAALEKIVKSGGNFLYDFSYYVNSGLMSKGILKDLEEKFSIELRNANLKLNAYSRQYNRFASELALLETETEDYISNIAAENEYQEKLLKEKGKNDFAELESSDYVLFEKSVNAIEDTQFIVNGEVNDSFLNKVWMSKTQETNDLSTYIYNNIRINGEYFIHDKIVDLRIRQHEALEKYNEYMSQANILSEGRGDEYFASDSDKEENSKYIDYCYYISLANDLYWLIDSTTGTYTRKGYCTVFIENLIKLEQYRTGQINNKLANITYQTQKHTYSPTDPKTLHVVVNEARQEQDRIWKNIYSNYGDFIVESFYTDSSQITGDALYLVAQKEFAAKCNPSVDYSATIIDLHKVLNVYSSKIELGDIIYFYNKDLYNEYSGIIFIEIPYMETLGNLEISKRGLDDYLPYDSYSINEIKYLEDRLLLSIKEEDQDAANDLLAMPIKLKINNKETAILNKYLDMKPKPIQLQITGITKKLRDATTQLTVSNNRMVENLLGKILRRTK